MFPEPVEEWEMVGDPPILHQKISDFLFYLQSSDKPTVTRIGFNSKKKKYNLQ